MILNLSTDIECTRFNILRFINREMLVSIAFGAISLFATVSATYLFTWYGNPNMEFAERQVLSQTVAFCDLLGRIFLAFIFRSEKEPLNILGVFSNRVIAPWALMAMATMLVATSLPAVERVTEDY